MLYQEVSQKLAEDVSVYLEPTTASTLNFIDINVETIKSAVLSSQQVEIVPLLSLNSDRYKLGAPLWCQLRYTEGCYVAELVELNLLGSGVDKNDALDDLKICLVELLDDLHEAGADQLGKEPLKWKVLLEDFIEQR
ncbi:hypothetical protein COT50_02170 [candidate division WWE3 bacterium CG08_land_8_20_14_0_20_41_10]|uniref:Uncharacterized protein n=1 Tax=candidate division WWE3 bacterium CG08_land_8_20_14_0_20_41_10 TaxID=1975085 RepID=A0A2H0XBS4_UNCKA|nr:MAG: hypothetical protein COT50_02170 [candidate division WWE3 bacterium CG08_land_8_20_14_0_20_41_10]